jgi:uncharacterized protein
MPTEYRDALFSPKIVYEESKGHKRAVAAVPIFVDEILVRWDGRVATGVPSAILSVQIDENKFLLPFANEDHPVLNHSCDPNGGMQGPRTVVAMRPIKLGEEITFDYAMAEGRKDRQGACSCSSPNCRGAWSGEDWKLPDLQAKYGQYFSPFLLVRIADLQSRK